MNDILEKDFTQHLYLGTVGACYLVPIYRYS